MTAPSAVRTSPCVLAPLRICDQASMISNPQSMFPRARARLSDGRYKPTLTIDPRPKFFGHDTTVRSRSVAHLFDHGFRRDGRLNVLVGLLALNELDVVGADGDYIPHLLGAGRAYGHVATLREFAHALTLSAVTLARGVHSFNSEMSSDIFSIMTVCRSWRIIIVSMLPAIFSTEPVMVSIFSFMDGCDSMLST